jgi:Methyltransferase domain
MEINFRDEFGILLERLGLKGHAVEIGVAEGRNARVLISQPAITKLYLIDNWAHLEQSGDGGHHQSWHENNYKETLDRIRPWQEKAVVLKGMSGKMLRDIPDDSLVFAYIDCDHSYYGFLSDLTGVMVKVKLGGVVAGHDVLNPAYGVGRALNDWASMNGYDYNEIHYTEENGDKSMVSFWFVKK